MEMIKLLFPSADFFFLKSEIKFALVKMEM